MAAVARATGVSQGAISSLLNDRDYGIRLSRRTRARIIRSCRELGYVPNDLRAIVRIYPELGDTCLFVPESITGGVANPFLSRIAASVLENTTRKPATLALIVYNETRDYSGDELPAPLKHGTASKLICAGRANDSVCQIVHERGLPAILLGHSSPIPGTTSVVADFLGAARLAFGRLADHGHKEVGIIGDPFGSPEPRMSEMDKAVGQVAHEMGFQIQAQNVFHGNLSFEAGAGALDSMLTHDSAPTALLCLSEAAAMGVIARAQARGISVPGQLSVLAFVDHSEATATGVPLTAVVMPADEMGAVAVREAERQVLEGIPESAAKIVIDVRLVERDSCGPAKR
jgi:LacI family transcriptional regulator